VVVRAKITVAARVFRAVLLMAQGQTETQALVAQQEQVVELAAALRVLEHLLGRTAAVGAVAVLLFSGKGKICTHLFHLLKLFRLDIGWLRLPQLRLMFVPLSFGSRAQSMFSQMSGSMN
jgi:hypothetical protein